MLKPKAFFVVSRYNEDLNWILEYTNDFLIYNKGEPIADVRVVNTENIGGNQRDIFKFIYENYENLPELIAFLQAYPFDHCQKIIFDNLIYNEFFTSIEYYGSIPSNNAEQRDANGGYLEANNSWYISSHNSTFGLNCKYSSLDEFMNKYFINYEHTDWIRFSPGSQYLIEKRQALFYPRSFWKNLMNELTERNSTEAHIVERVLWTIFQCNLVAREA
jgi:hypothetical protein